MTEIVRVCKVHGDLTLNDLRKDGYCKQCGRIAAKRHRLNNIDALKSKHKRYRENRLKVIKENKRAVICAKHGILKEGEFDKWGRCIDCRRAHNRECYQRRNKEWQSRERAKIKQKENPEKQKEYADRYLKKNPERVKQLRHAKSRRYVDRLYDGYVKSQINKKYGFERKTIPKPIIEIERTVMIIKRKQKETRNESKDTN